MQNFSKLRLELNSDPRSTSVGDDTENASTVVRRRNLSNQKTQPRMQTRFVLFLIARLLVGKRAKIPRRDSLSLINFFRLNHHIGIILLVLFHAASHGGKTEESIAPFFRSRSINSNKTYLPPFFVLRCEFRLSDLQHHHHNHHHHHKPLL